MLTNGSALVCAALLSTRAGLCTSAGAQGTAQTVNLVTVEVQKLAAGYRSSRVVGSSVVNEAGETIGKVDDLLASPDGKQPYAVLSIGGTLVSYDTLRFAENKVMLPGGTKDSLNKLSEFEYSMP